jgi:hypothetical protein
VDLEEELTPPPKAKPKSKPKPAPAAEDSYDDDDI